MTPNEHLERLLREAEASLDQQSTQFDATRQDLDFVYNYQSNRSGVRFLMTCLLAKVCNPVLDPLKPYTEIGTPDSFSGRNHYDEQYIGPFVTQQRFDCNPTTAFLTPGFRTKNRPLVSNEVTVKQHKRMYQSAIRVLEAVAEGQEPAEGVFLDILRRLIQSRTTRLARLESLQAELRRGSDELPLSSEAIVTLIEQHVKCKRSSRLPVLLIAAVYDAVVDLIGEQRKPLHAHTAADEQTGAAGDVEVLLTSDNHVCTVYEMKQRVVSLADVERAVTKVANLDQRVDNYIFVTTDRINKTVQEYAVTLYENTGGTEFAILDCIGFLRHFLHLFHRRRIAFLDAYQSLVCSVESFGWVRASNVA